MKVTKLYVIVAVIGVIGVATYYAAGEKDAWVCVASAWNIQGAPSTGVPSESCEGIQTIYLDVRTAEEWNAGHIKGAVHSDVNELIAGVLPDIPKDANIQVYCRSGNRAETAKQLLNAAGYSRVTNAGGLKDLTSQGYPIE